MMYAISTDSRSESKQDEKNNKAEEEEETEKIGKKVDLKEGMVEEKNDGKGAKRKKVAGERQEVEAEEGDEEEEGEEEGHDGEDSLSRHAYPLLGHCSCMIQDMVKSTQSLQNIIS